MNLALTASWEFIFTFILLSLVIWLSVALYQLIQRAHHSLNKFDQTLEAMQQLAQKSETTLTECDELLHGAQQVSNDYHAVKQEIVNSGLKSFAFVNQVVTQLFNTVTKTL